MRTGNRWRHGNTDVRDGRVSRRGAACCAPAFLFLRAPTFTCPCYSGDPNNLFPPRECWRQQQRRNRAPAHPTQVREVVDEWIHEAHEELPGRPGREHEADPLVAHEEVLLV